MLALFPQRRVRVALATTALLLPSLAIAEPTRLRDGAAMHDLDAHGTALRVRRVVNRCVDADLSAPAAGNFGDSAALWDGVQASGLTLLADTRSPITVRFAGAPKFVNRITLLIDRCGRFTVDLLDPWGAPVADVGVIEAIEPVPAGRGGAGALQRVELPVPTGRYTGFQLRPLASSAELVVHEMAAQFYDPELNKDASEVCDEWCADYPGTGNDLSSPPNTAGRFSEYFNDHGWDWLFDFGNSNAWEEDFKLTSLGGTNDTWVDTADHVIYCGHGSDDQLSIARADRDDATLLWSDASKAWGNLDLEWVWLHCCLNLVNFKFHNAMDGLHTIAGFVNVISSADNWGKTIAEKLLDTGAFDSPETIYQAWWHANDSNQPSGDIARLIAEDQAHFNEYTWGEGTVEADSPDATHWYIDQTVSKMGKLGDVWFGRGPQRTSEPVAWEPPPTLGKTGTPALRVLVHPEVLQKQLAAEMPMFQVNPPQMTPALAAQLLQRLCPLLTGGCPPIQAGAEDREAVAASAGNSSLWGSMISGGFLFAQLDKFKVPLALPPNPITPAQASNAAGQYLQALFTLPAVQEVAVRPVQAVGFEEGTSGQITEVDRYLFSYDVVFGRMLGLPGAPMFPVLGRGGRTTMNIGAHGELLGVSSVQRAVSAVGTVQTLPLQAALDQLSAFGYNVLESPPETLADQVVVRDVNMGYFERGYLDPQTTLPPIFYMDVDLVHMGKEGSQASVPARLYMAANTPAPLAQILTPGDGSVFPIGALIPFTGRGLGGQLPYSFRWLSSSNGVLSTQPQFATKSLVPSSKVVGQVEPETITLEVTDANGFVSTDAISIILTGATNADTPERYAFALQQNAPNPFNPRTTIAFSLDLPAHATLAVFDVRGRHVRTLLDADLPAGPHARLWDSTDAAGRPVAAGVYIYRLETEDSNGSVRTLERKLTLVK